MPAAARRPEPRSAARRDTTCPPTSWPCGSQAVSPRSAISADLERRGCGLVGLVGERPLCLTADGELALVHLGRGLAEVVVPVGAGEIAQVADIDRLGGDRVAQLDRCGEPGLLVQRLDRPALAVLGTPDRLQRIGGLAVDDHLGVVVAQCCGWTGATGDPGGY